MRCLETRTTTEGFRRRRYRHDDGRTVRTIEVPVEVWNSINKQGRARDRAAEWTRARERDALRVRARALMLAGWKPEAVSSELKVPTRTLQRWRKDGQAADRG